VPEAAAAALRAFKPTAAAVAQLQAADPGSDETLELDSLFGCDQNRMGDEGGVAPEVEAALASAEAAVEAYRDAVGAHQRAAAAAFAACTDRARRAAGPESFGVLALPENGTGDDIRTWPLMSPGSGIYLWWVRRHRVVLPHALRRLLAAANGLAERQIHAARFPPRRPRAAGGGAEEAGAGEEEEEEEEEEEDGEAAPRAPPHRFLLRDPRTQEEFDPATHPASVLGGTTVAASSKVLAGLFGGATRRFVKGEGDRDARAARGGRAAVGNAPTPAFAAAQREARTRAEDARVAAARERAAR
jgi:hypothetical protein